MELAIHNISGKKTEKKVKLSDKVFGIEPNDHAIYLDVKLHLANQRQGTSKSKQRNEISGSSKKIKRQKGTGGARAGNIKNPQFRGGGRIHGPQPRDYDFKLNKQVKVLARQSALSYKAKGNNITVLEDFNFDAPKTKQYIDMLTHLKLDNKKTLVVIAERSRNIVLSSRNVPNTKVIKASDINTYDILNANDLVISESSVKEIVKLLTK